MLMRDVLLLYSRGGHGDYANEFSVTRTRPHRLYRIVNYVWDLIIIYKRTLNTLNIRNTLFCQKYWIPSSNERFDYFSHFHEYKS